MLTEIQLFECGAHFSSLSPLCVVCGVAQRAEFTIEPWLQQTNCSLVFLMPLPAQRNVKINSDEQHAIFAHELQSALRLTVGFANIYCEL